MADDARRTEIYLSREEAENPTATPALVIEDRRLRNGDRILLPKSDLWPDACSSGWATWKGDDKLVFDNGKAYYVGVHIDFAIRAVTRQRDVRLECWENVDCMIEQALCEGLLDVPDGWELADDG